MAILAVPIVLSVASVVGTVPAGAQQVPYDASKALVLLETAVADGEGTATADVTLPEDVTEDYEVIAAGIADAVGPNGEDVPRSVIATVSSDESAAAAGGWSEGEVAAAFLVPSAVDRNIHVSAPGFRPSTEVRFSVRYTKPAAASTGGSGLARTGSDIASTVAIGFLTVVVGVALVMWAIDRRRSAARA